MIFYILEEKEGFTHFLVNFNTLIICGRENHNTYTLCLYLFHAVREGLNAHLVYSLGIFFLRSEPMQSHHAKKKKNVHPSNIELFFSILLLHSLPYFTQSPNSSFFPSFIPLERLFLHSLPSLPHSSITPSFIHSVSSNHA